MEGYLFCLLACDRDSCCDGFLLAQVRGGNVVCNPGSATDGSQKPGCTTWKLLWRAAGVRGHTHVEGDGHRHKVGDHP